MLPTICHADIIILVRKYFAKEEIIEIDKNTTLYDIAKVQRKRIYFIKS